MKSYAIIIGLFTIGLLPSCTDFLDKEPISSIYPEAFMNDVAHLETYVLSTYDRCIKGHAADNKWNTLICSDDGTDDKVSNLDYPIYAPGELRVEEKDGLWEFESIRNCNYFLTTVLPKYEDGGITGDENLIKHCIGEMYFFRAYEYFKKLKVFGDFPIITEVLDMDSEQLIEASKRKPRSSVARFILKDLDYAIGLLLDKSPDGKKNRINKEVAYLFKSRVALFEASWLRNFENTAFVPNGPEWPGKASNPDFEFEKGTLAEEVNDLLEISIASAFEVIKNHQQLTENDNPLPQSPSDPANKYFSMFSDVDLSQYDEVLFWKSYSMALNVIHKSGHSATIGNNMAGTTKGFVDCFLMEDGRPYYSASSEKPYKGDDYIQDVVKNRDGRLQLFLKVPGQKNKLTNTNFSVEPKDEKMPLLFHPSFKYTTGYAIRKYGTFDGSKCDQTKGSDTGCPIFRSVEAFLNYIEAYYMRYEALDATAEDCWKKIRRRAGVSDDIYNTISLTDMQKEKLGDWGAYTAGKLVDETMYNIRRERRCELMSENMRMDDLRRWRSMDQMITEPYIVKGIKLWGPMNELFYLDDPEIEFIEEGDKANVSPRSEGDYLCPFQINKKHINYGGFKWNMAHYLTPIAAKHFTLTGGDNSVIYQNPGWGITTGSSCIN